MKPWRWFRALAVLLVLFCVGHTLGTLPQVTRGPQEAGLFAAMRDFRFPIMGFTRSHWEFYRGFSLTISVQLLVLGAIAWQVGSVSKQTPATALPMAVTLLIGCLGTAVLSWEYFFTGPIVFSVLAVLIAAGGVRSLLQSAGPTAERVRRP